MVAILIKALSLVLIVAIGYGIKQLGWVKASDFGIFSKIVLRVTLPCALATSFNNYDIVTTLLSLVVIGFVVNVGQQVTGYWLNRRNGPKAKAFGVFHSGTYNIGAFSTPYLAGIIGPHAMIFSTMFDIGGAFSTAGSGYAGATALVEPRRRGRMRRVVQAVFRSPVFLTYLLLVALMIGRVRLPDPVLTLTSTVGAANPYLAMTMIGVGLELRLPASAIRRAARMLAVRYAIALLATGAVWLWLPMAAEIRTIVCMLMFAPMASMLTALTGRLGMDVELSAFMTSVTIVIGIIAMPAVLLLLN